MLEAAAVVWIVGCRLCRLNDTIGGKVVEFEMDVFQVTQERQSNQLIGSIVEKSDEFIRRAGISKPTSIQRSLLQCRLHDIRLYFCAYASRLILHYVVDICEVMYTQS